MVPFSDLLILYVTYLGEGAVFAVIPHLCQGTLFITAAVILYKQTCGIMFSIIF